MVKCSHIKECQQKVVKGSLGVCHGKQNFPHDSDECYKSNGLDAQGPYRSAELKRAEEWQRESA